MENRVYISQIAKFIEKKLGEPVKVIIGLEKLDTETVSKNRAHLFIVKESDGIEKAELHWTDDECYTKYFDVHGNQVYVGDYRSICSLFVNGDYFVDEENQPYVMEKGALNGVVCLTGLGKELENSIPYEVLEEIKAFDK